MMNWKRFIAFRFFRSQKNSKLTNFISYISIITTIFLVALLMLIFGMLRGLQYETINKIIETHGYLSIASEHESIFDSTDPKNIIKIIGNNQLDIQEEIANTAMILNDDDVTSAVIRKSPKNTVEAIVNKNTIKKLKLLDNLTIKIATYDTPDKLYPLLIDTLEQKPWIVPIIYVNDSIFQEIFNMPNKVNSLKVSLKPDVMLSEQELDIKTAQIKEGLPNLKITGWKEIAQKMLHVTDLERKIFCIIVCLLISMCILVNFLAITMFIFSKKSTIRTLKTQQANRMDIISIFTQYNAILASISIILGLMLGYMLCLHINTILGSIIHKSILINEKIHVITNPLDVVLIFSSNFFSMILSAIFMSWKMHSIEFF